MCGAVSSREASRTLTKQTSTDGPRFVVHSRVNEIRPASMQMDFTVSCAVNMILRLYVPRSKQGTVPDVTEQLADATVAALLLFVQIIHKFFPGVGWESWDHSSFDSRMAIGVASGLACKFLMDTYPAATRYFLAVLFRPGELGEDHTNSLKGHGALDEQIAKYELRVMAATCLMDLSVTHRSCCLCELGRLRDANCVDEQMFEKAGQLSKFYCIIVTEFLPAYDAAERAVAGAALALLSVACIESADPKRAKTYTSLDVPTAAFALAAKMAQQASEKQQHRVQRMFGHRYVDAGCWEHGATKQWVQLVARKALAKRAEQLLALDGQEERAVLGVALCVL